MGNDGSYKIEDEAEPRGEPGPGQPDADEQTGSTGEFASGEGRDVVQRDADDVVDNAKDPGITAEFTDSREGVMKCPDTVANLSRFAAACVEL